MIKQNEQRNFIEMLAQKEISFLKEDIARICMHVSTCVDVFVWLASVASSICYGIAWVYRVILTRFDHNQMEYTKQI